MSLIPYFSYFFTVFVVQHWEKNLFPCVNMFVVIQFPAQITEWDLIFHGTETSAQPNDPPFFGKSEMDDTYGSEVDQNSLDFDPETASGQWRNMQQVNSTSPFSPPLSPQSQNTQNQ